RRAPRHGGRTGAALPGRPTHPHTATQPPGGRGRTGQARRDRAAHRLPPASGGHHLPMRRSHRVGAVERGRHGETVLRTAYLPHRADITSRTADHLIAAADAMRRLRRRFSRPGTRPDVIVATAPAIPTLMLGRAL